MSAQARASVKSDTDAVAGALPDAIAICGPTSSGKSEVALLVARALGGEIVNADSRQIYAGLPIGTGAPTPEQLQSVPHHLFGFVDPCTRYSAGAYVADAVAAIEDIRDRGGVPIVVGGTGLYVEALAGTMPMDRPVADDLVRRRVVDEAHVHPHEVLHAWLGVLDPPAAARVPTGDRYRTLRALEAALSHAQPARGVSKKNVALRLAVLDVDAVMLRARIAARVRAMYGSGLVEEAIAVWRRCADAPALTGLGYAEALAWFRGEATRAGAIDAAIVRTQRYAKRQRTWFRRMRDAIAVDGANAHAAAAVIVRVARETARTK